MTSATIAPSPIDTFVSQNLKLFAPVTSVYKKKFIKKIL